MANLGWLFYKDYFNGIDYRNLENERNENHLKKKILKLIDTEVEIKESFSLGNIHFQATTTYPGLLLGSGYLHELPKIDGQAILGFDFDYTTGLPIIRGSSIKGVLRSAFEHEEYIKELLELDDIDVKALEKEIFDNGNVFFDAIIVKANSFGKILGDDFLAPHGDNPLKNPTPLRFIKILPDVTFRFDFILSDYKKNNLFISKNDKIVLFSKILSDFGIGAKTNVGYGKFEDNLVEKTKKILKEIEIRQKEEERKRQEEEKKLREQQELEGKTNIEKIKYQIKDKTKKETKDIYEIIEKYELNDDDKKKLITFMKEKIGEKPKPKNKASIKWAIRIYEFLGL